MDADFLLTILFVFLRISSFIGFSRIFFPNSTPKAVKFFFASVIAYIATFNVEGVSMSAYTNIEILICGLKEAILGSILALTSNISFETLQIAGSWIDTHIGISMISLYDPNSETTTTSTSKLLHYTAIAIFFALNGHHMLLKSIFLTYKVAPISSGISFENIANNGIKIISNYFFIGIKIALPIVLIILITDISLSLISRAVPQLNVMILGMPVKMIVGLIALTMAFPLIISAIESIINSLPRILEKILSHRNELPIYMMAVMSSGGEKSEEATPKKKQDVRKKGQVAKSKDISTALSLVVCTIIIATASSFVIEKMSNAIMYYFSSASKIIITENTVTSIQVDVLGIAFSIFLPIAMPILIIGIISNLGQTGFLMSTEAIKPKFSKINPLNGLRNIMSKKSLLELTKSIIFIIIISYTCYDYICDNIHKILNISSLTLAGMGVLIKELITGIFVRISILFGTVATIDYIFQRRIFKKEIMMTKEEVKEEYKMTEGNPEIKQKIKQKQRQIAQSRMMEEIPNASVIITNPTHIAIAIKYEEGKKRAPIVIAKGQNIIAQKIKDIAIKDGIPLIEDKPLARFIYYKVDINQEIPEELYESMAKILAWAYKIKNKRRL